MTKTGKTRLWRPGIAGIAAFASLMNFAPVPALAQSSTTAKSGIAAGPRRLADGKPDLNGLWAALHTASWNIQDHGGQLGIPPGKGVVEGNEIPYQPWALAKQKENFANR